MPAALPAHSPRAIALAAVQPQRWRNGGGETRELLAWPAPDDWRLRISVADIGTDGPFSAFPGVERWFCALQGGGVELTVDGVACRLRVGDPPCRFSGAAATRCRLLDGPTRDLNLMLRDLPGGITIATAGSRWLPRTAACGLFSAVVGRCRHDGGQATLTAETLLWFDVAPAWLLFEAEDASEAPVGWWLSAGSVPASPRVEESP